MPVSASAPGQLFISQIVSVPLLMNGYILNLIEFVPVTQVQLPTRVQHFRYFHFELQLRLIVFKVECAFPFFSSLDHKLTQLSSFV